MGCSSGWRNWRLSDGETPSRRFGHTSPGGSLKRNVIEQSVRVESGRRRAASRNLLPSHNLPQRRQQPVHFVNRVVVHQSDAQKSSEALDVQLLGDVQGIVVSVPGEKAARSE